MPEDETVRIQGVLLSYETFDALPEGKIDLLAVRPNYEQTPRVLEFWMQP